MDLAAFLPGEGRPKQVDRLVRSIPVFSGEEASYSSGQPVRGDAPEKTEHWGGKEVPNLVSSSSGLFFAQFILTMLAT